MKKMLFLLMLVLMPTKSVFAHGSVSYGGGFLNGMLHPIFGLDHLLAMIAVGIVSVQLKKYTQYKSIYGVPILFVASMVVGGFLGIVGNLTIPLVEVTIMASVILLGVFMLFENVALSKISLLVYISVIFFGFFHGFAHGTEVPKMVIPIFYIIGFGLTTIIIHILGIFIGERSENKKLSGVCFTNLIGAFLCAMGVLMFIL